MRRTGYANVVATLALIVAVGGTSYAATQITGKDVKNGSLKGKDVKDASLTGKDLKKQSVPLDRLSGTLPQVDPGQFVAAAGLYNVSVGPNAWQSLNGGLVRINDTFGGWKSTSVSGQSVLMLDPALPMTVAGKAMRLRAVTICWDDTAVNLAITDVNVSTYREDANADFSDVNEIDDATLQNSKTCKRYAFSTPVALAANSRVNLKLSIGWGASDVLFRSGGVTFELDRG